MIRRSGIVLIILTAAGCVSVPEVNYYTLDLRSSGRISGDFVIDSVRIRVGEAVEVLCALDADRPVAVQQGNLMATSFHPELTNDYRFHSYFLKLAGGNGRSPNPRTGTL